MKESIKIFENAQFGQIRTSVAEKRIEEFIMQSIKGNINITNNEI